MVEWLALLLRLFGNITALPRKRGCPLSQLTLVSPFNLKWIPSCAPFFIPIPLNLSRLSFQVEYLDDDDVQLDDDMEDWDDAEDEGNEEDDDGDDEEVRPVHDGLSGSMGGVVRLDLTQLWRCGRSWEPAEVFNNNTRNASTFGSPCTTVVSLS